MGVRVRVDPIGRDIDVMLAEVLSPAAQSQALADVAREALAEGERQNAQALGFVPDHETFVDGRAGAAFETVKPDGTIIIEFDLLEELFVWIAEQLVKHSPFRSGRFAASHAFFADGIEVDPMGTVPPAETYVFVNTQPYARKIERGQSPQAPDGVFEAVAALASRRFGNLARIWFTYEAPLTGAVQKWALWRAKRSTLRENAKRRQFQKDIRQPAILIQPR